MSFIVKATLYVTRASLQDAGILPVSNWLTSHGWEVESAVGEPLSDSIWNAEGHLAESQPVTFTINRLGASQESAVRDVTDAISATGNYSFASSAVTATSNVVSGVGNLISGLGKSADPNAPDSPLLSTVKFVAVGVMAVAVVVGIIYVAPILRAAKPS